MTVDDEARTVVNNRAVYILLGAVRRMENLGKLPRTLIEVETCSCFIENNIIRHEDVYSWRQGSKG